MFYRYKSLFLLMVVTISLFSFMYHGIVWCEAHKISDPSVYDAQGLFYFAVSVFVVAVLLLSESLFGKTNKNH